MITISDRLAEQAAGWRSDAQTLAAQLGDGPTVADMRQALHELQRQVEDLQQRIADREPVEAAHRAAVDTAEWLAGQARLLAEPRQVDAAEALRGTGMPPAHLERRAPDADQPVAGQATTETRTDQPVEPGAAPFPGPDHRAGAPLPGTGPAHRTPPAVADGLDALTDLAQQTRTDQDGDATDG